MLLNKVVFWLEWRYKKKHTNCCFSIYSSTSSLLWWARAEPFMETFGCSEGKCRHTTVSSTRTPSLLTADWTSKPAPASRRVPAWARRIARRVSSFSCSQRDASFFWGRLCNYCQLWFSLYWSLSWRHTPSGTQKLNPFRYLSFCPLLNHNLLIFPDIIVSCPLLKTKFVVMDFNIEAFFVAFTHILSF